MVGGHNKEEYYSEPDENLEGMMDEDEESCYSEGELMTRAKLITQKSYSAPYILLVDCFNDPLQDSESQINQKAYTTSMLENLELKEQSDDEDNEGEGMNEEEMMQIQQ